MSMEQELVRTVPLDEADLQHLAEETRINPYKRFLLTDSTKNPALVVISCFAYNLFEDACEQVLEEDESRPHEDSIEAAFKQILRKKKKKKKESNTKSQGASGCG
jgi:hypothetical protein